MKIETQTMSFLLQLFENDVAVFNLKKKFLTCTCSEAFYFPSNISSLQRIEFNEISVYIGQNRIWLYVNGRLKNTGLIQFGPGEHLDDINDEDFDPDEVEEEIIEDDDDAVSTPCLASHEYSGDPD